MLDPNELIFAYTKGYFPMADPDQDNEILWYKPERRGIIPLDQFHVPKNLRRLYKQGRFQLKTNTAFREVMQACADRDSTWISPEIIDSYCTLHEQGYAHSFEAWKGDVLVGGLYGVAIHKAFFGESMFFKARDASKLCLVHLVETLKQHEFILLDTQYINDHLLQFGAIEVHEDEYEQLLEQALAS